MSELRIEKLSMESSDITQENINKIKELFPQVVTEGKIDFDLLKTILGEQIENQNERYQFTWNGKSDTIRFAQKPSTGTLRPDKESSKNWDTTENLYIEGDNLEVLKLLQKTYHNKIKMIYIDPPYNTGGDFVYKDDFKDSIKNYKEQTNQTLRTNPETSGRYHTDWLNMMYSRLMLAKNLLTDDGVIYISIDDNEIHNIRKLCDEVFGEVNFIDQLAIEITKTQGMKVKAAKDGSVVKNHEYVIMYSKSSNNKRVVSNLLFDKGEDYDVHYSYVIKQVENTYKLHSLTNFLNNNDDVKKILTKLSFHKQISLNDISFLISYSEDFKRYIYEDLSKIIYQETACDISIPNEINMEIKEDSVLEWNGYLLRRTSGGKIRQYISLFESLAFNHEYRREFSRVTIRGDLWKNFYSDMMNVAKEGDIDFKNGKKPVRLIKQLIFWIGSKNDIVVDFFSGSATTAHAVMQLNAEDGGNRKFIMVQLPEKTDEKSEAFKAGYSNICEIGKERIRRAGDKIKSELVDKKHKDGLLEDGIDPEKLDIGFKVFKLDSSNINTFDCSSKDIDSIFNQDVFVSDRSQLDILYEILLKYGVFDKPIEILNINGKEAFSVAYGHMIVFINHEISENDILKVIELKPREVIIDERGFITDNDKMNAVIRLEAAGVEKISTI